MVVSTIISGSIAKNKISKNHATCNVLLSAPVVILTKKIFHSINMFVCYLISPTLQEVNGHACVWGDEEHR